jgi:hypothetical protein
VLVRHFNMSLATPSSGIRAPPISTNWQTYIAYFAKQLFEPNRRIQEKGAHNYFQRLAPINLLVKQQARGIWMVYSKKGAACAAPGSPASSII